MVTADADTVLLERLRRGEEAAFVELAERCSGAIRRLVRAYVPSPEVADEVVRETWLAALEGLHAYQGRPSLRTWLLRIAIDRASTRGSRERRTVAFPSPALREIQDDPCSVDPERFLGPGHDRWPHHWATPPTRWQQSPERHLGSQAAMRRVRDAIDRLPPAQRLVITLRDVEHWDGTEVCNALGISETNQRALLHRARSRVRADLDAYFTDD